MDLRCELLVTFVSKAERVSAASYACLLHSSPLFRICSAVSDFGSISRLWLAQSLTRFPLPNGRDFFSVAYRSALCPVREASFDAFSATILCGQKGGCGFAPSFALFLLLSPSDARLPTPHAHFRALETCTIRCSCPVSRLWHARLLLVQYSRLAALMSPCLALPQMSSIPSQKPLRKTKRRCHSSKHLSLNQSHQLVWR
ncbi:hypothetical protein IWX46DRAFT_333368 [Phyllosticta citricarpa]|uniref:Uncharacterized protein n=1 Tax=Phyllosticta citricarpa TaxID=55181 RepID=A0ABR1LFG8_9PEZI